MASPPEFGTSFALGNNEPQPPRPGPQAPEVDPASWSGWGLLMQASGSGGVGRAGQGAQPVVGGEEAGQEAEGENGSDHGR